MVNGDHRVFCAPGTLVRREDHMWWVGGCRVTQFEMPPVQEEHFEDQATGIEREGEDHHIDKPWDPAKIRVSTKQFSIRQVMDQIDDKDLELAPDFQRNQVWKPRQKSGLIESILLQIPLPAFYFAETPDGLLRVVDGLQRLSAIHSFMRHDGFPLRDLEYLKRDVEGKRFDELALQWRRRMDNTQIFAHVIDPKTPTQVTYDIFKRINTGGTPLKPQEIRHCMSRQRSRDFLKSCTQVPEFEAATGGSLKDSARMDDREVVLRFCAFRLLGVDGYAEPGRRSMEVFLMDATERLDDVAAVGEPALDNLRNDFQGAMANSTAVFGEHAFRKWPESSNARNPINKALFESWAVALADLAPEQAVERKQVIVERARALMSSDSAYIDAISTATGDPRKVEYRFTKAQEAAAPA